MSKSSKEESTGRSRTIFSLLFWQKGTTKTFHQQFSTELVVQTIFSALETHRDCSCIAPLDACVWLQGTGAPAVSSCNRAARYLRSWGLCTDSSAVPKETFKTAELPVVFTLGKQIYTY